MTNMQKMIVALAAASTPVAQASIGGWTDFALDELNAMCDSDAAGISATNEFQKGTPEYAHEMAECHTCYYAENRTVGNLTSCNSKLSQINIGLNAAMAPYVDLMECGVDYFSQEPFPVCINGEVQNDEAALVTHDEFLENYPITEEYLNAKRADYFYETMYSMWVSDEESPESRWEEDFGNVINTYLVDCWFTPPVGEEVVTTGVSRPCITGMVMYTTTVWSRYQEAVARRQSEQ